MFHGTGNTRIHPNDARHSSQHPELRDSGRFARARYHPEQGLGQHAALASQPSSVVYNANFRLAAQRLRSHEIRELGAEKEYPDGNMKVVGTERQDLGEIGIRGM